MIKDALIDDCRGFHREMSPQEESDASRCDIYLLTRPKRFRLAALAIFLAAALVPALAGESPRGPRLASSPQGRILAGCQILSGDDGEFELFASLDEGGMAGLGRYHGRLAGVAVGRYDGKYFGLTRDGALSVYGDDPEVLAIGDARWNMLDLAWFADALVALDYSAGVLALAYPDRETQSWRGEVEPIVADPAVGKAVLAALGDELHLVWGGSSGDLSRGALRHMVRRDGRWRELPSLPLGDLRTFTVFPHGDGLLMVAVVPDPVDASVEPVLASWAWFDGTWLKERRLPDDLAARLRAASGLAGAWTDNHNHWLLTNRDGAFLISPHAAAGRDSAYGLTDASAATGEAALAPGAKAELGWSEIISLLFILSFIVLALLYCRRSRRLALSWPGRPPDLTSRGMALLIDWTLVSVGMTAYHLAAGDARIYQELLTFGGVNEMFWTNMAALALFSTVTEYLYGRTPGKWMTGLRVRSVLGGPPGFLQALFRNAMRGIDMFPLMFPGVIGALVSIFNPRRQRVGDILAGTVVRRHAPFGRRRYLLASASPRRLELLRALGLDVRADPSGIDEDGIRGEAPEDTARMLAEAKARAAAGKATQAAEVVVAADTMVLLDGQALGKPRDAEDARRMLGLLSGKSHTVITGLTLWDSATGQGISDVEHTEVEFRVLSQREIDDYVASGDPMDKAGAYGVQTGFLVKEVRGSLSNVAGLPMEMLQRMLSLLDS